MWQKDLREIDGEKSREREGEKMRERKKYKGYFDSCNSPVHNLSDKHVYVSGG